MFRTSFSSSGFHNCTHRWKDRPKHVERYSKIQ